MISMTVSVVSSMFRIISCAGGDWIWYCFSEPLEAKAEQSVWGIWATW